MGGNALKTFFGIEPRRIQASEFEMFCENVLGKVDRIQLGIRAEVTKAYKNKPSHGDLDVVVSLAKPNIPDLLQRIQRVFGTETIHHNSNCYSVLCDGAQVDLIFVNRHSFEAELFFRDYSPFGNIVSRMLKQIDVSWKTSGLYYVFRHGDSYKKDLFLTMSKERILQLAGLYPGAYGTDFNEESDIFNYVCSSTLFRKDIYFLENLNHINRKRDAVRPDYNRWNEFILDKPDSDVNLGTPESRLYELYASFPLLPQRIIECYKEIVERLETKVKFNGDLVSCWTGLEGKHLGLLMAKIKQEIPKEELKNLTKEDVFKISRRIDIPKMESFLGKIIEDEEHGRGIVIGEEKDFVTIQLDDPGCNLLVVAKHHLIPVTADEN